MQMIYELYDSYGNVKNRITASKESVVRSICQENGYEYKVVQEDKSFDHLNQIDLDHLTNEKIKAISEQQDFIEDCIAEMAMRVYEE